MANDHPDLIVTTGNEVEGFYIAEVLGIVRGIVVRAQSITQGIRGAFASLLGGNITAYEEVCEAAREHAYERLIQHAREHGANAVIGMRYDATEFAQGITEVVAYGTAVRIMRRVSPQSSKSPDEKTEAGPPRTEPPVTAFREVSPHRPGSPAGKPGT